MSRTENISKKVKFVTFIPSLPYSKQINANYEYIKNFIIKGKASPTVLIKTIAVDFTEGQSIYPKLKEELNALEIGILFNNVGMLPHFGQTFHTMQEIDVHDVVNCNMMSLARMCHIILPQMIERKKGIIVNIGSLSSSAPTPLLSNIVQY